MMKMKKAILTILMASMFSTLVGCGDDENKPLGSDDPIRKLEVTDQDCKDIAKQEHRGEVLKNKEKIQIIASKCSRRSTFKPTVNPKSW